MTRDLISGLCGWRRWFGDDVFEGFGEVGRESIAAWINDNVDGLE